MVEGDGRERSDRCSGVSQSAAEEAQNNSYQQQETEFAKNIMAAAVAGGVTTNRLHLGVYFCDQEG